MWPFEVILALYLLKIAGYWALKLERRSKQEARTVEDQPIWPSVDIILPMHNEAKVIVGTIQNLLTIDYQDFSIIVVDDGSTDGSSQIVQRHFHEEPRVRLFLQENGGKSAALMKGMSFSRSEIIVSIDADTWVRPDSIKNIVSFFADKKVSAVSGHIKVGNRVNLLTDMQYVEYISIWDNDREILDVLNGILIVPGALGAYRSAAVQSVGGFRTDVIAEDTELTLRLLHQGHVIRNAKEAVAFTEAPDDLKMFFRQRVRWTVGLSQGLIKHNKRLFTYSNRYLAIIVLPYTWLFRVILPFFLPMVDYYFLASLITSSRNEVALCWFSLIMVEGSITTYLLQKYGERVGFFRILILQRFYRHLLFCNYILIFVRWINGTLLRWNKIKRKGNISLNA